MRESILVALAIATGLCLVAMICLIVKPWELFSSVTSKGQMNRYRVKKVYNKFNEAVYKLLSAFKPTKIFIDNLAYSYRHLYVLEDREAKFKAVNIVLFHSIVFMVVLFVSNYYFSNSLLAILTACMVTSYTYQKISGDGSRFLADLEEMLSDMSHIYNAEDRNIDRMMQTMLDDKDSRMHKYLEQMYEYLKKAVLSNDRLVLAEYNRVVASRHLRLIFNYLYITYRYGDEVGSNGEIMFNRNIMTIQREVHSDLMKLERIKGETLGEQVFIILAVIMIPAARWYMDSFFTFDGFETIGRFLNSSYGKATEMVCASVAVACFYIYSKFMRSSSILENHKEVVWEDLLASRSYIVRNIIRAISPKEGTKKRRKLLDQIDLSEHYKSINMYYVNKVLCCIVLTLSVSVLLFVDGYNTKVHIVNDIYRGVNTEFMDTVMSLQENAANYAEQSISNDITVIDLLNERSDEYYALTTKEARINFILHLIEDNGVDYGQYPEIAAERVYEKTAILEGLSWKMNLLVALIVAILSYKLPNLDLWLGNKLNAGAIMYDEVNGYYTIVVLLCNHSASSVYMMLNWITSFSNIFKKRLTVCMDTLSSESIQNLQKDIAYKPLSRLIDSLLMAYEGAEFKAAFAGIEQTHLFQEESRKLVVDQVVKRMTWFSEMLSWCAMGTTFGLYIMLPMGYAIYDMLAQIM